MEFLNLITNGFAYIFSTIEKKVEINLLMKSFPTVSLGHDAIAENVGWGWGGRKTLPLLKTLSLPQGISFRTALTQSHFYSSLCHTTNLGN